MIDYHLPLLSSSEAILVLSESLMLEFANPAALHMMCLEGREMTGISLLRVLDGGSAAIAFSIQDGLLNNGHWSGDTWLERADSPALPVRLVIDRYQDAQRWRHACVMSDISHRKLTEAHLTQLSQHDSLTGLFNRAYVMHQLDSRLSVEQSQYALLFVDVDDLKKINDALGHHIGDLCLCEVARRLMEAVGNHRHATPRVATSEPIVARIGGDEFVILLPISERNEAQRLARSISELMNAPWYPRGRLQRVISTSIGIAYAPQHGNTSKSLLRLADRAMYRAKRARKGSVHEIIGQPPPPRASQDESGFGSLFTED